MSFRGSSSSSNIGEPAFPDERSQPPRRPRDWRFAGLLVVLGLVALMERGLFALRNCLASARGCGTGIDVILAWMVVLLGPTVFVAALVVWVRPRRTST